MKIKSGAATEETSRSQNGAGGARAYGTRFAPTMIAMANPRRMSTGISRKGGWDTGSAAVMLRNYWMIAVIWLALTEIFFSLIASVIQKFSSCSGVRSRKIPHRQLTFEKLVQETIL
jgi:hypothetical protein